MIVCVIALMLAAVLVMLLWRCFGRVGQAPMKAEAPTVETKETPSKSDAQSAWEKFIAAAKENCAKQEGVSVDFDACHEYDGRSFGVMAIGWKDSEYVVDLYCWDDGRKEWVQSPTARWEVPIVDVAAASEKWNVPTKVIEAWLEEANTAVQRKYGTG